MIIFDYVLLSQSSFLSSFQQIVVKDLLSFDSMREAVIVSTRVLIYLRTLSLDTLHRISSSRCAWISDSPAIMLPTIRQQQPPFLLLQSFRANGHQTVSALRCSHATSYARPYSVVGSIMIHRKRQTQHSPSTTLSTSAQLMIGSVEYISIFFFFIGELLHLFTQISNQLFFCTDRKEVVCLHTFQFIILLY